MLVLGIGLILIGLVLLLVPAVGLVLGLLVAAAGVVLLVLHFVRVFRTARAP